MGANHGDWVPVELEALESLFERIGKPAYFKRISNVATNLGIPRKVADAAKAFLLRRKADGALSLSDIAEAFSVRRQAIHEFAQSRGIPLSGSKRSSATHFVRWFEKLAETDSGRRRIRAEMRKAAADKGSWLSAKESASGGSKGTLDVGRVLSHLGYPGKIVTDVFHATVIGEALQKAGLLTQTRAVGVILFYGLGTDPRRFIEREYSSKKLATVDTLLEEINRRTKKAGLLAITRHDVVKYMTKERIPFKTSGSRVPHPYRWVTNPRGNPTGNPKVHLVEDELIHLLDALGLFDFKAEILAEISSSGFTLELRNRIIAKLLEEREKRKLLTDTSIGKCFDLNRCTIVRFKMRRKIEQTKAAKEKS